MVKGIISHFSISKITLLFLVVFLLLMLLPVRTFAQISSNQNSDSQSHAETPSTQTLPPQYNLNTNPDVPLNLNTYTQSTFIEILSTASCFLTGANPINPHAKCLGVDQNTGKLGYVESQGGLTSVMGGLIAQTFVIPVSTSNYTHYLARSFGITENSYAQIGGETEENQQTGNQNPGNTAPGQGVGFVGLTPLIPIWLVFRNLAYLAFVLVFILLGLGIMFRLNIDARTVMTIQNQIPKIIIALVLITFSYAIAGFLIDLMYVATYLVINLFQTQGLETISNINTNPIKAVGFLGDGIFSIASAPASSVATIISSLFDGTIGSVLGAIVGTLIGGLVGGNLPFIGGLGAGVAGSLLGGLGGALGADIVVKYTAMLIAYLILVIAILHALFRTWIMLIKAYVYILLDVIFAPFWIILGLFPTGSGGFGSWIRSLLANLATFPLVITLFMVGRTIIENLQDGRGNFVPPMVGNPGENSVEAVGSLIGLGIILIMPEALNVAKSALKAPDFKLTSAAGRAIGAGQSFWSKPAGKAWHELTGEKRDGTRGPLGSFAHERTNAIARRLPIVGENTKLGSKMRQWKEDERARARNRMYGTELPEHLRRPVTNQSAKPATPPENPPEAETVDIDAPDADSGTQQGGGGQGGGPILPT